jgi:hypothetical protein
VPPKEALAEYLAGALPLEVTAKLKLMSGFPGAEEAMKLWRKDGSATWWMEGTIRAVAFDCVNRWIDAKAPGAYLAVAEQQYPQWPNIVRSDIAIRRQDGKWLLIEIKADFSLSSVLADAGKLIDAYSHLAGRYFWGVALYSVEDDRATIDRWQAEVLKVLPDKVGVSRPLIMRR